MTTRLSKLIRLILTQELYFGAGAVILGVAVAVEDDLGSGIRASLYSLIFFQLIILWLNRAFIKAVVARRSGTTEDKTES